MKRALVPVLLIIVSVTWCRIEYQPITGELLEHWNTTSPSCLPKVYYYDSSNLPDGIYELRIAGIEVERDSLDIYLLGIAPYIDIPFLLATSGYRGDHNFTKSCARYVEEEDEIYLSFQMPGSARWCTGCYRWNIEEESLEFLRYYSRDPSLEAIERADSLMAEGSISEAIRELDEMFYPHNYYNSDEMIARLLRSINRAAGDAEVEGNYVEAVSLFGDLAGFLHTDREWFTAFTDSLDYVNCDLSEYMGLGEYVMIMNNYAYYLELTDDLDNSLVVLRKVLDLKPDRMVAHLNIADVLWGLGEPAEAEDHYSIYLRMMIDLELTHQIPVRVYERIAQKSAASAHFVTSSFLYSNVDNYMIDDGVLFASMLGDESDPDNCPGIRAMDINTGREIWFYKTSDDCSSADTPWYLRVKDGRIYAMVNSSGLHCLDTETGQLIHLFEVSDRILAPHIVTENILYIATITEVIAYDLLTGDIIWSFMDQASPSGMYPTITNQYAYGGNLYIGFISANVMCLDADNGELVWNSNDIMDSGGAGYAHVNHVSDNLVFVSTASGELSLLHRNSGQVLEYIEDCKVKASCEEAIIIYQFYSKKLLTLDPESGTVIQEIAAIAEMDLYSSLAVQCEETICFGCRNGMLLAVPTGEIRDGSMEPVVIGLAETPLTLSCYEGTIVAASKFGDITLVDANTFEVIREISTDIEITGWLEFYDGFLYFKSGSSLYTLRLDP